MYVVAEPGDDKKKKVVLGKQQREEIHMYRVCTSRVSGLQQGVVEQQMVYTGSRDWQAEEAGYPTSPLAQVVAN